MGFLEQAWMMELHPANPRLRHAENLYGMLLTNAQCGLGHSGVGWRLLKFNIFVHKSQREYSIIAALTRRPIPTRNIGASLPILEITLISPPDIIEDSNSLVGIEFCSTNTSASLAISTILIEGDQGFSRRSETDTSSFVLSKHVFSSL